MRKDILLIFILISIVSISFVNAQTEPLRVDFFYSQGCPHCAKVIGYLEYYESEHPNSIEITRHDVSLNSSLFIEMQSQAGIPVELWSGVPKVFVGDYYCIGSSQCHEELLIKLDELIESGNGNVSDVNGTVEVNPYQILGLAAVDAVNPCALAVLTFILIAILVQNPGKKRKVLTAGLSFAFAIFITYFLYGLIIIQLFRTAIETISGISLYLYGALGLVAILLGILNVKDFFSYKPGSIATEMPMKLRPIVKKLTSKATSAGGAFVIGIFVTLFLLPCTIGPYIITGGILSGIEFIHTIPWLLIYNIIFVVPMMVIVLIVYLGFTTVDNVSGWKDKNIRYLHLISGLIMMLIGFVLLFGII